MNTKNLLIAGLIGGVVTTAVSNIPFISLINCLLCVGFWGGGTLAAWYYKRASGSVTLGQGTAAGAVAGVIAAVLGILLSFLGAAGAEGLMNTYAQYLPPEALQDVDMNMAGPMQILFNLLGAVITFVLVTLGGLIGGLIFRPKTASTAIPPV